ncbi:MAG: membrane protein insertase YidC [Candidatus Omnitrophota bacterium]
MEKRVIIAIALSLLILLGFQLLSPKRQMQRQSQAVPQTVMPGGQDTLAAQTGKAPTMPDAGPRGEEPLRETLTEVQTEQYSLIFSDMGGSLKTVALKEYQEQGKEEILVDNASPPMRLFAMQSELFPGLERKRFEPTKKDNSLEYRMTDPGWVEITKRYTFHKSFNYITLEVFIKNLSSRSFTFSYQITGPADLKQASYVAGRSFLQANALIDDKVWKIKAAKGMQARAGNITWVALKNRYFAMVLKPLALPVAVIIKDTPGKNLLTALDSRQIGIAPGETIEDQYLLYAGPLDEKKLSAIGPEMGRVVDYGFFGGVSKALLAVLRFFHRGTKNWGLAIIFLTILINIVLFPLTLKSFSSMHQMKQIQPHIQKLKELHKDNPQKLNKEMMALYKTYNVNPLGGCLPMLLQMPIFISLYQGLMGSIELKGSAFLWIKDLSKPDAVTIPFSLPVIGAHINILPLLMVGMMVLQQKFSQGPAGSMTDEQAGQQKMMMLMMPIFFGFLFYNMPSGLVLYWLTNTILMTVEQGMISKRMNRD